MLDYFLLNEQNYKCEKLVGIKSILTKYMHITYLLLKIYKKFNLNIYNALIFFYLSLKLQNKLYLAPQFKKQINFRNYLIKTYIVDRRDKTGKNKRVKLSFTTWKIYKQLYKSNKINKNSHKLVQGSLFYKSHQTINRVWRETPNVYNVGGIIADFKLWSETNKIKNASAFKLAELPTMIKNSNISNLMLFTVKNALRKHYLNAQKRTLNGDVIISSKGPLIHQVPKTHTQYKVAHKPTYLKTIHNQNYFSRVYITYKIKTKKISSNIMNFETQHFIVNNNQIKLNLFDKIFANNQFSLSTDVLPVTIHNTFPLLTTKHLSYLRKRQQNIFGCITYDMVLYNTLRNWCQDSTVAFSNYNPLHKFNTRYNHVTQISVNTPSSCFYTQFIVAFLEKYLHSKVWIKINPRTTITPFYKTFINQSNYIHNIQNRRIYKDFSTIEFLEIFILTLQTCDLQILMLFFKKVLESTHFKNHKKILSAMFDIIRKNSVLFKLNNVSGFSFDIRGKVGVTGNAKKRHIFFSVGKTSTTTQKLKSQWQQINVWTQTGQMGITCVIQY